MDEVALTLSRENPVFVAYALAASLMLLKLLLQPWMTVFRMMKVRAGFRSPEDVKRSPINPTPDPAQLEPNEYVERSRRLNLNDLESIPAFLVAGLLFVLAEPPLLLAHILLWTYVIARAAHFVAYVTAQVHDIRATLWTVSSLSVLVMVVYTLVRVLGR
ncbi:MAPEG family protein [Halomonas maura]|uniref:MAPEG family protein n=1 Tax=Halomonas maura TaxID=117606 RepID=UPI0025B2C480|nr:MAPEG family protein [Halomonas maura]MDN3557712.1 MAPEG family protein [Halomonas maura]